ncbi:MAG: substrate-binding domain-containing protein [Bacteroidales bacterium]|nr:substrate-binding domain-containing protein [Bacteroidales bacterium]
MVLLLVLMSASCQWSQKNNDGKIQLHVIHAGSLTLPVHEISRAFMAENPGVMVLSEAWGSKQGARRVIDIANPADVFLSADYMVIENMLIPGHASWYIPFATNELAIVYTERSRFADKINRDNWMEILMRRDVAYGRSNPDQDPCGVRSVFAIKLAEKKYGKPGFAAQMLAKDTENIRPKETDLIALLDVGQLDYIFLYKSVAIQHGLKYLELPDSLNLGNFALNDWYRQVQTETLGTRPGERTTEFGEAMVYGLTIPHKTTNPEWARKFVAFVTDPEKGSAILQELGQGPVTSFDNPYREQIELLFGHNYGF